MTAPEHQSQNPDIYTDADLSDLLRFAHWGSSFTLTIGENFNEGVRRVTDTAYPNVPEQHPDQDN